MFFAQKMHDKFSRISLSLPGQKYAILNSAYLPRAGELLSEYERRDLFMNKTRVRLAALLLVTLFAVLLLLGQLKSPREELAKSLTFRMEAFQSDMESLWRNVSVMGLHLSEDMTAILEK